MAQKLTLFMRSLLNTHTHTHTPGVTFQAAAASVEGFKVIYTSCPPGAKNGRWDKWLTEPKKPRKEKREKDGYWGNKSSEGPLHILGKQNAMCMPRM